MPSLFFSGTEGETRDPGAIANAPLAPAPLQRSAQAESEQSLINDRKSYADSGLWRKPQKELVALFVKEIIDEPGRRGVEARRLFEVGQSGAAHLFGGAERV